MKTSCRILPALLASMLLAACQAMPPLNFSAPNVSVSAHKLNAELRSITVTIARPEEQTGALPAGVEAFVPQLWQTSLTDALNRMAIFQDDGATKVNLAVRILQLEVPAGGLAITSVATARYELIDRKSGAIVFSKGISTSGTSPATAAFDANIRKRESLNSAVQGNIAGFLEALQGLDIDRALAPGRDLSNDPGAPAGR